MSGEPYFVHVLKQLKFWLHWRDLQTIVAGLLHDVLEDTEIAETEIEKNSVQIFYF